MRIDPEPTDAFQESLEIQGNASMEGFDWDSVEEVLDKAEEEISEIREAIAAKDEGAACRELGDLLLVAVNLSRFLKVHPAEELRRATRRFANRYAHLKNALSIDGKMVKDCSVDELESYWQRVKGGADEALSRGLDMAPVDGANSRTDSSKSLDFKGQNEGVDKLLGTGG